MGIRHYLMIFTIVACRSTHPGSSDVQIFGGDDIPTTTWSSVVEIESDFGEQFTETCTATFIRPRVLLTAAHCVFRQRPKESAEQKTGLDDLYDPNADLMDARRKRPSPYRDLVQSIELNPGAQQIKIRQGFGMGAVTPCFVIPKGWGVEKGGPGTAYDVALIFFDDQKEGAQTTLEVSKKVIPPKTPYTAVGFGWNKSAGQDSHIKRQGKNMVAEVNGDILLSHTESFITNPTNQVSLRQGDSGGPMIVDGKVVAVASALLNGVSCTSASCANTKVDVTYHVALAGKTPAEILQGPLRHYDQKGAVFSAMKHYCAPFKRDEYLRYLQAMD